MKIYIILLFALISLTFQHEIKIKSNRSYQMSNHDNMNDSRNSRRNQCIVKGQYNQYCVFRNDNSRKYNKKVKFNKKYKCLSKAICSFKNGKCQWLSTKQFKRCLDKLNSRNNNNHSLTH